MINNQGYYFSVINIKLRFIVVKNRDSYNLF